MCRKLWIINVGGVKFHISAGLQLLFNNDSSTTTKQMTDQSFNNSLGPHFVALVKKWFKETKISVIKRNTLITSSVPSEWIYFTVNTTVSCVALVKSFHAASRMNAASNPFVNSALCLLVFMRHNRRDVWQRPQQQRQQQFGEFFF